MSAKSVTLGQSNVEQAGTGIDNYIKNLVVETAEKVRHRRHDHVYEPGAYAVCRRCGEEYADHVADNTHTREAFERD